MNNVTLIKDGKPTVYHGPAGWAELGQEQYLQYCRALDLYGAGIGTLMPLLVLWYGLSIAALEQLTDENRLRLFELLSFLDTRPDLWMVPRLKLGRLSLDTYMGPGHGLEHLTFGEFIFAEAALQQFQTTDDRQHLARLTAALYRPYYKNGPGGRLAFQAHLLDAETERAMRLPAHVLTGVLINYMGCRDKFPVDYPHLFSRSSGSSGDGSGNWVDVGLSLARQTSALGTFAQLEQTNLYLALTALDQIMREHKEMEQRLKQNSHG